MASDSEHAQMLSRARARTSVFKQTSLLKHKGVAVVLTEIISRRDAGIQSRPYVRTRQFWPVSWQPSAIMTCWNLRLESNNGSSRTSCLCIAGQRQRGTVLATLGQNVVTVPSPYQLNTDFTAATRIPPPHTHSVTVLLPYRLLLRPS
jgi:hypothetical protein